MIRITEGRFKIGQIVATPAATEQIDAAGQGVWDFLCRHILGDWGDLEEEDKTANDEALKHGGRLFSAYHTDRGVKIWVITEADRSSTCILLPEEY